VDTASSRSELLASIVRYVKFAIHSQMNRLWPAAPLRSMAAIPNKSAIVCQVKFSLLHLIERYTVTN